MTTYRVVWEIDVFADSPKDAAQKALQIQRDPESIATCFKVSWIIGVKKKRKSSVLLDVTHK